VVKIHEMTGHGSRLLLQSRGSQLVCTHRTRGLAASTVVGLEKQR